MCEDLSEERCSRTRVKKWRPVFADIASITASISKFINHTWTKFSGDRILQNPLSNRYCHDLDIKLVFTTFKLRNLFSVKDSVPRELRSRVIYKFTCACCNACYIGETGRHFSTRVREHLFSDKSSHIFKHLLSSERCCQSCSADCFEILDSAPTKFQLKLKEAMHINWEKPNLNQQVHHVNLRLTL